MFGKLMSISDALMWRYYELLSFRAEGRDRARCAANATRAAIRATRR